MLDLMVPPADFSFVLDREFIERLAEIVGDENVLTEQSVLEPFGKDETPEIFSMPDIVAFPRDTAEIARIVALCYENNVPLTPRGAGTGVVGGAVPVCGGLVLSTAKMNQVVEIDKRNMVATVLPGMITGEFQRQLETEGLFYPPDPASVDSCSIGGNVATCAGGMRAVKYGTTRDFVRGLKVIVPPGEVLILGGKMIKDVAGYDLMRLIVGSEGTLGIIGEITVRLLPMPPFQIDLLAGFKTIGQALDAAFSAPTSTGVQPAVMEFIEGDVLVMIEELLEKKLPLSGCGTQIIISLDGFDEEDVVQQSFRVGEHLLSNGAIDVFVADNKQTREIVWKARRSCRDAVRHRSNVIDANDISVPPDRIPELMSRLKSLAEKNNVQIVGFGHIGDGNVHTDLLKGNLDDGEWRRIKEKLVPQILAVAVELGGTITGEHGIGFTKRKFFNLGKPNKWVELQRGIKKTFDPKGILNPMKVFPDTDEC